MNLRANLKQMASLIKRMEDHRSALLAQSTEVRKLAELIHTCAPKKYDSLGTGTKLVDWADEAIDRLEVVSAKIDNILNRQREDDPPKPKEFRGEGEYFDLDTSACWAHGIPRCQACSHRYNLALEKFEESQQ